VDEEMLSALADDLNTPLALARLAAIDNPAVLRGSAALLGLLAQPADQWFRGEGDEGVEKLITARAEAKARRDFAEADRIRDELKGAGVLLEDGPQGTTWRRA
jgi:cysteinyl-tRNA synthetase